MLKTDVIRCCSNNFLLFFLVRQEINWWNIIPQTTLIGEVLLVISEVFFFIEVSHLILFMNDQPLNSKLQNNVCY